MRPPPQRRPKSSTSMSCKLYKLTNAHTVHCAYA